MQVRRVALPVAVAVSLLISVSGAVAPRATGLIACRFNMQTGGAIPRHVGLDAKLIACPPPPSRLDS